MTRVVLLGSGRFAGGLRDHGFVVEVAPDPPELARRFARWRAIDPDAVGLPAAALALRRARPDVVHAFGLAGAALAAEWARRTGGAAVFSLLGAVERGNVADLRLRMRFLQAALAGTLVWTAPDAAVAASAERWLGVSPRVLDPADAPSCAALYEDLLA